MKTVLEMLPQSVQDRIKSDGLWDYRIHGGASQLDDVPMLAVIIHYGKTEETGIERISFFLQSDGTTTVQELHAPKRNG